MTDSHQGHKVSCCSVPGPWVAEAVASEPVTQVDRRLLMLVALMAKDSSLSLLSSCRSYTGPLSWQPGAHLHCHRSPATRRIL